MAALFPAWVLCVRSFARFPIVAGGSCSAVDVIAVTDTARRRAAARAGARAPEPRIGSTSRATMVAAIMHGGSATTCAGRK